MPTSGKCWGEEGNLGHWWKEGGTGGEVGDGKLYACVL